MVRIRCLRGHRRENLLSQRGIFKKAFVVRASVTPSVRSFDSYSMQPRCNKDVSSLLSRSGKKYRVVIVVIGGVIYRSKSRRNGFTVESSGRRIGVREIAERGFVERAKLSTAVGQQMGRRENTVTFTGASLHRFPRFYVRRPPIPKKPWKKVCPLEGSILGRTVYKLVTIGTEGFQVYPFHR